MIYTLCDLLEHVYKKFMAADISTQTAKSIIKLDTRFKVRLLSLSLSLSLTHSFASGRAHLTALFIRSLACSFRACACACAVVCVGVRQHHLLSPISKDTTAVAVNMLKQQMNALDSIFASSGWEEGAADE